MYYTLLLDLDFYAEIERVERKITNLLQDLYYNSLKSSLTQLELEIDNLERYLFKLYKCKKQLDNDFYNIRDKGLVDIDKPLIVHIII